MMAQTILVGGTEIAATAIAAEAQNHPSDSPEAAWAAAAEALAVRQLLLNEADRLGIVAPEMTDPQGRRLVDEDARIEALLEQQVHTPTADEEACRRYYDRHPDRFTSPTLVEASHILIAAPRDDEARYAIALDDAKIILAELKTAPERFADIAQARSACPSAEQGGNLGQIGPGQTVDEFETFLFNLELGQLCPVPVKTRFGVHIIKAGRRVAGERLPFAAVATKIAAYLEEASWRRAVAQYVVILAGKGGVEGITLGNADGSLVQ